MRVFVISDKIVIHCTFTHDSDDETEVYPIVTNREVKISTTYSSHLIWDCLKFIANLCLCELL
jgi:hypothetical protein